VIGCDGIKGISRKAVLGRNYPEEVPSTYTKMYVYRSILPMSEAKAIVGQHAGDAKWWMSKGRSLAMYPISKGTAANFVAFIQDKHPWTHEQTTLEVSREEMMADLEGWDNRLLKLLEHSAPVRWPLFHHPTTPTYYSSQICLLGDVAHASSPHQAAGAGQGLEDALILSRLLGLVKKPSELEPAFKVYDSIRRPRAQRVVSTSWEAGFIYTFEHEGTGSDMQKIVDNANGRLGWIWTHDLEGDVRRAEELFRALTEGRDEKPGFNFVANETAEAQVVC